jgi:hypothetical protein
MEKEEYRVYWLCSAPFYADPFSLLEKQGCAIPLYEEGPGAPLQYVPGDEGQKLRFGRELVNPIQEEAGVILTNHWAGTAERRVQEILLRCRQLKIDGLVHFQQFGCETCNLCAKVIGERAERELGVSSIYLDGSCQDLEKHNEEEFEQRLDEWLQIQKAAKKERQL